MSSKQTESSKNEKENAKTAPAQKAKPTSERRRPVEQPAATEYVERPRYINKNTGIVPFKKFNPITRTFWIGPDATATQSFREAAKVKTGNSAIVDLRLRKDLKTGIALLVKTAAGLVNGEISWPVLADGVKCKYGLCCFRLWNASHRSTYAHDMAAWLLTTLLRLVLECDEKDDDEEEEDYNHRGGDMLSHSATQAHNTEEPCSIGLNQDYRIIAEAKTVDDVFVKNFTDFLENQIIPFFAGTGSLTRFGGTIMNRDRQCKTPVCHAVLTATENPASACKHVHFPDQIIATCLLRIVLNIRKEPIVKKGPVMVDRDLVSSLLTKTVKAEKKAEKKATAKPAKAAAQPTKAAETATANSFDALDIGDVDFDESKPASANGSG